MDLRTTYLGLTLENPLVASPSPLSATVDGIRRLADAGVGAVVLPSLFEEQLRDEAEAFDRLTTAGSESFGEAMTYFPDAAARPDEARRYLSLVERAAAASTIPVIASLNGATAGGWVRYARSLQEAGAAAIELNIYNPPGDATPGRDVEALHLEILSGVRAAVAIPVAVKLTPYFSSLGEMALRLDEAGADGLVLFNRFLQPDIDHETLAVVSRPELSTASESRLPMTWIALLRGRVRASLAATGGVTGAGEVAKLLLAGADVVMTASALLRQGPLHARVLLEGLTAWMEGKGYASVDQLRGTMSVRPGDERAAERSGFVDMLQTARRIYGHA